MFQSQVYMRGGEPVPGSLDQVAMSNVLREHKRLLLKFTARQSFAPHHPTPVVHGHTTFDSRQGNEIWHTPRSEVLQSTEQAPVPQSISTSSVSEPSSNAPLRLDTRPSSNLRKNATVSHASRSAISTTIVSKLSEVNLQPQSQTRPSQPPTLPLHLRQSQNPMSSSEYRASTSPSGSGSPSPRSSPVPRAPRRSGRSKNQPLTYNVRQLLGLESQISDGLESFGVDGGDTQAHIESAHIESEHPTDIKGSNLSKLIWDRELCGLDRRNQIRTAVSSDLQPWKAWKGASNDVLALAWSPDGTKFAAGATTQSDEYNRDKNLLVGDLVQGTLYDLPAHWVRRPNQTSGVDQRLFTTVSSAQWVGQDLYTASYDRTVKIWDVKDNERPLCRQTLNHNSEVVTIALSEYHPNLVATGTNSFGFWDIKEGCDARHTSLPINRTSRQKNHIELTPTNLVWGHTASTKNLLVGGMSERSQDDYQVPLCGHLGLWRVNPDSVTPLKVSPDSQNVFDVKWHPRLPKFATATTYSPSMSLPSGMRSVLTIYGLSSDKFLTTHQLPCPAQDMNELTFCPMDSIYVTASCTDGITYVWDVRNPGTTVHRLQHGDSLQPLNHEYPRELTDSGVNLALWGTTIDQFYTGASDGCLKQWDIRRAPENVLVTTTANLAEGIVSGSFSPDKSHLLLGDHSGGIHVLSSGPCADPDDRDFKEIGPASSEDTESPSGLRNPAEVEAPDPDSGVELAKELISSGQLEMHPIYGPVQGTSYDGPYASWARDNGQSLTPDQLKLAPLRAEYQMRQFDGPPLHDRPGLDAESLRVVQQHFNLAYARSANPPKNGKRTHKRKREGSTPSSSAMVKKPKKKKKKKRSGAVITNVGGGVIDLTGDCPEPEGSQT